MAKKSMKIKQARPQKYSTREYNRCKLCGRPHAYIRKYSFLFLLFKFDEIDYIVQYISKN